MKLFNKNDEVEVMSEKEGFRGAWFKAILEENTTRLGKEKFRVKYSTLLGEDKCSPLVESVEQRCIRPVPPLEEYKDIVSEEGVVVDADYRDGWWRGVVVKELKEGKYLVYFESLVDVVEFEKERLRANLHWNDWIWVRPGFEGVVQSEYCTGTVVEVSEVLDKDVWVPSMIITEVEKEGDERMFIVKYYDRSLNSVGDESRSNKTVALSRIRPEPPVVSSDKEYKLLDVVEAFRGSSWLKGVVRAILSGKRYMVNLGATVGESVFIHSDIRPLKEWNGSIWRNGTMIQHQTVKETPSTSVRKRSLRACTSAVKPMTPKSSTLSLKRNLNFEETVTETESGTVSRKKMAATVINDDTPLAVILNMKTKAKEPGSSVTPSPVTTTTPVDVVVANDDTPLVIIQQVKPIAATPSESVAETGESTSFEQVTIQKAMETDSTQVKPIAKEVVSSVTASSPASPLKQPVAESGEMASLEKTLEQVRNQYEIATTQQKMNEDESKKRKREAQQHSTLSETDGTSNGSTTEIDNTTSKKICNDSDVNDQPLSSLIGQSLDQTPNTVKNSSVARTHVDETRGEAGVTSLPFTKKSPYWKTCETTESFQTVPQRPHFSLLSDAQEDIREWAAVGMTFSFYGYLDEVKGLKLDDPPSKLNGLIDDFAELEKYGFNVETAQSRVRRMLSLQNERKKNIEEKKCLEEKLKERVNDARKMEEELADLKRRILELERLEEVAKEKKEEADKKMVEMESSAVVIKQKLAEVETEFERVVSAPW